MRASNPAGTADAEIEIGDSLRCRSDGWEGVVTDLDEAAQKVTLLVVRQFVRVLSPEDVVYNWWDPKIVGEG